MVGLFASLVYDDHDKGNELYDDDDGEDDDDDDVGDIEEIKVFGRGPRGVKCVSDILTQVDCPRNRFRGKNGDDVGYNDRPEDDDDKCCDHSRE